MKEIWKNIEEAPNYLISNYGNVKNKDTGRILKGGYTKGRAKVSLMTNGKLITRYIHTLVATYFVNGKQPGLEVNHMDGDKTNNFFKNLEWATRKENMDHAVAIGRIRKLKSWIVDENGNLIEILRKK